MKKEDHRFFYTARQAGILQRNSGQWKLTQKMSQDPDWEHKIVSTCAVLWWVWVLINSLWNAIISMGRSSSLRS